jgi:hypothetical protein
LSRLHTEQEFRKFHRARFERGITDPSAFDGGTEPLDACVGAMISSSRVGIVPCDLEPERKLLTAAINDYAIGLRRRLLRH